jgi:uncharacterized protein YndB with AHSA1/START domain
MRGHNTHHATFVIERCYDAPPSQIFRAFADPLLKPRWFAGPEGWERGKCGFDFRVGGRECSTGGPPGEPTHCFDAVYQDIVPNQRIVYSYDMHLGDKRISVSLTTIELQPAGTGTRLVFTEQGVFLDGYDDAASREQGTRCLLDKLDQALSHERADA